MKIAVTGGAGFIGGALVRHLIANSKNTVVNIDKLTYAGNLNSIEKASKSERYEFAKLDICKAEQTDQIFAKYQPDVIMHLAAESHVDRSIDGPQEFMNTNILGTFNLLQSALGYWDSLDGNKRKSFRFLHVSTDEVYGSLGESGLFTEKTPYSPNSPYSASKASSDHLVRAWHHTYGLPTLTTNCSNNYGSFQFPEKLIPLMIINAVSEKKLPVYGNGKNIRDWIYVDDHVKGLCAVLENGTVGEVYNLGGRSEQTNLQVVECICDILDEVLPRAKGSYKDLIEFVTDRPGHDFRYAIDSSKSERDLGWAPNETFESGLKKTVEWYLEYKSWWKDVQSGSYRGERLGLG